MARKWWTLLLISIATFMLLLDITIVNVALPDIQRDLHASLSSLQWVVDAYSLTLAAFLLTAGVVGDIYGQREVFAGGLVIFSVSSLVCGLSTDPTMLNIFRGIQGIGAAGMLATTLALIAQEFHGPERATAFGIWGATIGGAVAVGGRGDRAAAPPLRPVPAQAAARARRARRARRQGARLTLPTRSGG